MKNDILAQQIILLRNRFKMTQEDLAVALGYSKQTISNWETGLKTPRMGAIQKLADYFNVSKSFLIDGEEVTNKNILSIYNRLNESNQIKVYNFAEKTLENQNNNIVDLREYRDIDIQSTVSAGTGVVDLDASHVERISYNGFIPNKYDAAFRVQGDSMEPVFQDGEIVFVVKDEDVRNGQIGVVLIDGEAFIKKMYVEGNKLRLVSLNKQYEDIIANGSNQITVYGRVVL